MGFEPQGDNPHSGDGASPGKIFIGGLAKDTTYTTFNKHFGEYGEITDSVIMKNRYTGQPRGFGFITYADPSVVDKVSEDDHMINGKQEIELEAHAVKGIGKIHAKWSPVATAWHRMLPEVVLLEEVCGSLAEELKNKCPVNVFDIEDIGNGTKRATVARPRACTLCRECIRGAEEWEKRVSLRRIKDHFIFTIESTGALPPEVLFTEATKILEDKCERLITQLS